MVRLTDRPDMTLDVNLGRKTTIQLIKFLPQAGLEPQTAKTAGKHLTYLATRTPSS